MVQAVDGGGAAEAGARGQRSRRDIGHDIGQAIAAAAILEWRRWGELDVERRATGQTCVATPTGHCEIIDDGCGREQSARWCGLVNRYWAQAFIHSGRWFFHDCSRLDVCALRWPADQLPIRTPAWSAAFVSTVVHEAGLSDAQFPRTPYHADYVRAALDTATAAYRVESLPATVEPGSLVCALRDVRRHDASADDARAGDDQDPPSERLRIAALRGSRDLGGPTPMHCDIVVAVDRLARRAWAIGGNVMQSVARLAYPLDAEGRITAVAGAASSPLLVMRLRALAATTAATIEATIEATTEATTEATIGTTTAAATTPSRSPSSEGPGREWDRASP